MADSAESRRGMRRRVGLALAVIVLPVLRAADARADLAGRWNFGGSAFVDIAQVGDQVSFTYQGVSFSGTLSGGIFDAVSPPCFALRLVVSADETILRGGFSTSRVCIPGGSGVAFTGQRCECDDGNSTNGDGCSAECQIEECYTCSGMPSVCSPVTDGTACDDGSACTTGETCNGGSCGDGAAVVPCVDMTGSWHVHDVPEGFDPLDSIGQFVQVGSFLRQSSGAGAAELAGTIDPSTGAYHLDGILPGDALDPFLCTPEFAYNVLDGHVSANGLTFVASGEARVRTVSCFEISFDETGSRCGGGTLDAGEECDDGNVDAGDGCSASCALEPCYQCSGEPSVCAAAAPGSPCDDTDPCTTSACDASAACVATGGEAMGTPCDDGDPCTLTSCDGAGSCAVSGGEPAGTACDDADPCTVTACDGTGACAVTAGEPSGTACDDGDLCTLNACDGLGSCVVTGDVVCPDDGNPCSFFLCLPAYGCLQSPMLGSCDTGDPCVVGHCSGFSCVPSGPVSCDDGHVCTIDSCDSQQGCLHEPALDTCRSAEMSALRLDAGGSGSDRLVWQWRRGAATTMADLGDPLNATGYRLCVFAGQEVVSEADLAPGSHWSAHGSRFNYFDRDGTVDGVRRLVLKAGADGKARIALRADAPGLDASPPPLALPITAQLSQTGASTSVCWSSTFDAADIRSNDPQGVDARSSAP